MKTTKGEIFNLGNPKETRIIDLAKMIIKLTNSKSKITYLPLPENDPLRRLPNINKAKKLLSFYPKTKLEDGLSKTIQWNLENNYRSL